MEAVTKSSINISYFVDFETNSVGSGKELKSSMRRSLNIFSGETDS